MSIFVSSFDNKIINYLNPTNNSATVQPKVSLDEFVSIANEARPKNSAEVLQPNGTLKQREVIAGQRIWETAEDYTRGNDLELSMIHFLEESTGEKVDHLHCVDPTRPSNREKVYLTNNYAIKVFSEERFSRIPPEISGQNIIKQLYLQEGKVVEFITIGKCEIDGKKKLLLLMERAPGYTIKESIDSIFSTSTPLANLQECKNILAHLGRFLGEIHTSTAITYQGDPSTLKIASEKLKIQIENNLEAYKKAGGKDFDDLKVFFDNTLEQYYTNTFHLTMSHGDAHLANFIFDQSIGMSVIDTPWVPSSVNEHGFPFFASFAQDVGRVELEIATSVLNHTSDEKYITELQEAFRKGYTEKAHKLINPSQMFAEKACGILGRLNTVIEHKNQESPKGRLCTYLTNYLKKTPSEDYYTK